jgi:hypothetical protein
MLPSLSLQLLTDGMSSEHRRPPPPDHERLKRETESWRHDVADAPLVRRLLSTTYHLRLLHIPIVHPDGRALHAYGDHERSLIINVRDAMLSYGGTMVTTTMILSYLIPPRLGDFDCGTDVSGSYRVLQTHDPNAPLFEYR